MNTTVIKLTEASHRVRRTRERRRRAWLKWEMLRAHLFAGPRARFWALAWDTAYHRAMRLALESKR